MKHPSAAIASLLLVLVAASTTCPVTRAQDVFTTPGGQTITANLEGIQNDRVSGAAIGEYIGAAAIAQSVMDRFDREGFGSKDDKKEYKAAKKDVKTNMKAAEKTLNEIRKNAQSVCDNGGSPACLDVEPGSPGSSLPDFGPLRATWHAQQWWKADQAKDKFTAAVEKQAYFEEVKELASSAAGGADELPRKVKIKGVGVIAGRRLMM